MHTVKHTVKSDCNPPTLCGTSDPQRTGLKHAVASALLLAQVLWANIYGQIVQVSLGYYIGYWLCINVHSFCSLWTRLAVGGEETGIIDLPPNFQEYEDSRLYILIPWVYVCSLLLVQERGRLSIRSLQTQLFCHTHTSAITQETCSVYFGPNFIAIYLLRKWCLISPQCDKHSTWHPPLEGRPSLPYSSVTVSSLFLSMCVLTDKTFQNPESKRGRIKWVFSRNRKGW